MQSSEQTVSHIRRLIGRGERAPDRLKAIAEFIRATRGYRWAGIYEVAGAEIAAIAWTGTDPPAHPRFPVTQGLCGAAVESRASVVVADVRHDPRYLTTFASTRSEIVVPVLDAAGSVIGLLDAESEGLNAFGDADRQFLESCAAALRPIFRHAPA